MQTMSRAATGFAWTLVRTDFKTRYHGTIGGFVWALLKPLAMFLVLLSVFSYMFGSQPHYSLRLILGLFLYDFFAEGTKSGLLSLRAKGYLLTRATFPRWIVVVSSISNAAITLGLFFVVLLAYLVATGLGPSAMAVGLVLFYQVHYVAIVLGFALASSVLFMRYRDLNQVWEVVSQAGFFIAPIVYPLDLIPERLHVYLYLWPPTPIMLFTRSVLVDGIVPSARAHAFLTLEAAVILVLGAAIYSRLAARAAEYV
jgi:lipopolysaccharide transport system permease protein